jgi:hypothetical protein
MSYDISLYPLIKSRLQCIAAMYKQNKPDLKIINVIIDTGCPNSLIPLHRAKVFGVKTNVVQNVTVGNFSGETTAYIIRRLKFGTLELKNAAMFAGEFQGELRDTILLGLNILNNWSYTVKRYINKIEFDEIITDDIRKTKNPYQAYFSEPDKMVFIQE